MDEELENGSAGPSSSTKATNGVQKQAYRAGDHVYVGAPFEQREGGSPFMVCRILKLHPANASGIPTATVAYYLRRRDVTNRNLADHRVIFATFMTGIVPVSHIRQKCSVMFRDYLEDPEAFKKQDDSFVFFQIYDRFMHKPFDLIATSQILNAPDEVLAYIKTNYEFVCTELGTANDLCDATRSCTTCHGFAAKENSISCSTCSKTWHLGCVDPPLPRKPALGWRWNCIKCNMALEEEDDSDPENPTVIESDRKVARAAAAAKRKEKAAPRPAQRKGKARLAARVEGELDVTKWKSKDGWPYRYFGEHVQFDSVMDPHDSIYPRASTSVGTRFQALNIPGEPEETHVKKRPPPPKKPKGHQTKDTPVEIERGEDAACEFIWVPQATGVKEDDVEKYLEEVRAMPVASDQITVDLLTIALQALRKTRNTRKALAEVQSLLEQKPAPYPSLAIWTQTEMNNFDRNLVNYQDELSEFRRNLSKKSLPEIVHYYYRYKGPERQYMHHEDPLVKDKFAAVEPSGIEAEEQLVKEEDLDVGVDAEETSSLAGTPPPGTRKMKRFCAVCMTEEAEKWYKCPDGVGDQEIQRKNKTMCQSCAIQWRHYGNPNPAPTAEEIEAKESHSKKKAKMNGQAAPSIETTRSPTPVFSDSPPSAYEDGTPPPAAKPKARPPRGTSGVKCCVMCKRPEPKATLFHCIDCGIIAHQQCYGMDSAVDGKEWRCDSCSATAEQPDKVLACQLCPAPTGQSTPLTAINALKPAGENFVHLFCAIWHHELYFNDAERLDRAEGASAIEPVKHEHTCFVCETNNGACTKCESCSKWFHLSCAWSAHYRFCFEVSPMKESRASEIPQVKFKKEFGDMRPLVICKDHLWLSPRQLYDLGQKDKEVGFTAMMTFAKAYKSIEAQAAFPLLKVARLAALQDSREDGVLGTDEVVAPDSFYDIYARKEPLIRKPRKKRRKPGELEEDEMEAVAATSEVPTIIELAPKAEAKVATPIKPEPDIAVTVPEPTNVPQAFVPDHVIPYIRAKKGKKAASVASEDSTASAPKKRKRARKPTFSDAENGSGSEDEVMPQASTSRARRAVRAPVRSVRMADLVDGFGTQQQSPTVSQPAASLNGAAATHSAGPSQGAERAGAPHSGTVVTVDTTYRPPAPLMQQRVLEAQRVPEAHRAPTAQHPMNTSPPYSRTSPSNQREASPPKLPSLYEALSPKHTYVASTDLQPTRLIPMNGLHSAPLPPFSTRTSPVNQHTLPPISPPHGLPRFPSSFGSSVHDRQQYRGWEGDVKTAGDVFAQLRRSPTSAVSHSSGHATSPVTPAAYAATSAASSNFTEDRARFSSFSELNRRYAPPPPITTSRTLDLGRPLAAPHTTTAAEPRQHTTTSPFIPGHSHVPVRTADLQSPSSQ